MDFPRIEDGDTVIFDVETTGLDWKKERPCGYVVTVERGDAPESYYFPIRHESGPNHSPKQIIGWITSWAEKNIHLVGHNLKFDLHFAANDGIHFSNATFEDTQINGSLIDEHTKSFSLEALAIKYGAPAKKGGPLYQYMAEKFGGAVHQSQMANFWRLAADDPEAIDYATGDGDSTYWLWKNQQAYIDVEDLREVWDLECRVLPVLFRMERRGVRIDEERLEYLKSWVNRQLGVAKSKLPWDDFNVRSGPQLQKAFTDQGITDWPTTPKGNPSFVEAWLAETPLGQAIIDVRKLTNLENTFIQSAVEGNLFHGRVHCNFNQLRADDYGTITGRLSSSVPNMQQAPKRDKLLAPIFRSIFAADEGCFWSTNDYSQQEWRLFAAYVQNYADGGEQLVKAYNSGLDVHSVVAQMTGLDRDTTAKRLNMGMLNWMGVPKVMKEIGVDEATAKNIINQYHSQFPVVRKFLRQCQTKINNRGWIKTIKGRKARFPGRERQFSYRGASRVIQGGCADLTKEKLVEVDEYLMSETKGEFGIQLQVHDSLDWSLPNDLHKVDEEARRIMGDYSNYPTLVVPMKVDHGEGANWGEASFENLDWSKYDE